MGNAHIHQTIHFIVFPKQCKIMKKGEYNSQEMESGILHHPVTAVIFDMDNTLFDLVSAKLQACREVTGYIGRGSAEDLFSYFLRRQGGFEDPANIRDFLADHGCFDPATYERCCRIYRAEKIANLVTYPGVPRTLSLLEEHGYPMALVTDAGSQDAMARLNHTGLAGFFDPVVTFELTGSYKPSTLPFLYALEKMAKGSAETILVGDSPRRDIAPGKILGMKTVYARYGDHFPKAGTTGGADHAIDDIRDLAAIIGLPGRSAGHSLVQGQG